MLVVFKVSSFQLRREAGPVEVECESACTVHSCTVDTSLQALVTVQRIRVGSRLPRNRVAFVKVVERRSATPRVETLESLRGQARDRGSSSSNSSNRIVNRHGHHSRFYSMSAAVETVEVNETVSGRLDMLSSINTALQNVSAKPTASKPYRISDIIPRNWEGSNHRG